MNTHKPDRNNILIVAEPSTTVGALTAMLNGQGYEVRSSASGRAGLEAAQESPPGLLLLGTHLPDTGSYELCELLKADAASASIRVVFVGTPDEPPDRARVFAAGAADYVAAPFHEQEILARVQTQLALSEMRKQLADKDALLEQALAERQHAEEAIWAAEESGRDLVENLSEVIYTADEEGILTYASSAIESLIGYSPPEVVGHHLSEFIHTDDLARVREAFGQVLSGQQAANEYRIVTKSGEVRWVRTSSQPAFEGKRVTGAQGVLADITDQKLASELIRQQNEFLNRVLESLTHPFYVLDTGDYTVQIANSAALREGLAGKVTCYALTHGRSSQCGSSDHPCPLEVIKRTKQPTTVEHVHLDQDGNARNVEVHGYPLLNQEDEVVQIIEYALDITERRQAEEALERSEERYSLAQRAADIGSWDWDIRTGALHWSEQIEPMFGLAHGEFDGAYDSFLRLIHPGDRQRVTDAVHASIHQGADYAVEHRIVWPDGTTRWVSEIGDTIWAENGTAIRMLGVVQDVTERKHSEQALREAKESAEEARRDEKERRHEAERRRQIAESLTDVLAALNSNQSLDRVLDFIVVQARQLLDNQAVAIFHLQTKAGPLNLQAAQGLPSSCIDGTTPPPGLEFLEQAVTSGQPIAVPHLVAALPTDSSQALGEEEYLASATSEAELCQALLAVPIVVKGQVYGGIVIYSHQPRFFSDDDLELAIVLGDQVALAIENARLREQLKEAAAADERSRLARDLHDSVTQALFSASLVAEVLPQVWQRDPEEAQQGLRELGHLTKGALAEMRTMLLELRPHALLETKLDHLLGQLTEAVTSRAELLVSFEIEPIPALPPDVHVTFYRVSQEALHNVVKHAAANHVAVGLRASPPVEGPQTHNWQGQVILHVSDDGDGFDQEDTAPGQLGLGIMRERAEAVGAMLSIKSSPGNGTQITLVWRNT